MSKLVLQNPVTGSTVEYNYGESIKKTKFGYGLTLRPRAPLCQPSGYVDWVDFDTRCKLPCGAEVWAILWYDHELTEKQIKDYEMVRLPDEDC